MNASNSNSSGSDQYVLAKPSKIVGTEEPSQTNQQAELAFTGTKQALLKMLVQKRESKNMSPQDVEQRLKFKAKWVELLEAGDWSYLPQGASLRGFIKNYSKLLGIDSDILYNALEIDLDVDRQSIGRHTSIRALGDPVRTNTLNVKPVFWVIAGVIIVVVLIALMLNSGVFSAGQWSDSLKRLTQ